MRQMPKKVSKIPKRKLYFVPFEGYSNQISIFNTFVNKNDILHVFHNFFQTR